MPTSIPYTYTGPAARKFERMDPLAT
jgi:hypothetical protein